MPNPPWDGQYNFAQSPEGNGFVRWYDRSPIVTEVTGGAPANRRIEINSDGGNAYFQIDVPTFNRVTGITIEVDLQTSGVGNAGFEIALPDTFFGVFVYAASISTYVADGEPPHAVATAANTTRQLIRATVLGSALSVYRGTGLVGSWTMPPLVLPYRRAQFWSEEGGVQIFRAFRYYTGGAVPPG